MTTTDLLELDQWIAEHVTKKEIHALQSDGCYIQCGTIPGNRWLEKYSPTTDPSAAMEVLKKCIENLNRTGNHLDFCGSDGGWYIQSDRLFTSAFARKNLKIV